jgi:hypothetical protein
MTPCVVDKANTTASQQLQDAALTIEQGISRLQSRGRAPGLEHYPKRLQTAATTGCIRVWFVGRQSPTHA